jgi:hypothetical protein
MFSTVVTVSVPAPPVAWPPVRAHCRRRVGVVDAVHAVATARGVVARTGKEDVVPDEAVERVAAGPTVEGVGTFVTQDGVAVRRPGDVLDRVVGQNVVADPTGAVAGAERIVLGEVHARGRERPGEHDGVRAHAPVEGVVAGTTGQRVVARAAEEAIVAPAGVQRVVAAQAAEHVVAGAAGEGLTGRGPDDGAGRP